MGVQSGCLVEGIFRGDETNAKGATRRRGGSVVDAKAGVSGSIPTRACAKFILQDCFGIERFRWAGPSLRLDGQR